MSEASNCCILTACIAERENLRYTPAGIPALNLKLEHASSIQDAGQQREVKAALKAVAFGALAERLESQPVGSIWKFHGFLASGRGGKQILLHIQDISSET